MRTLTEGAGNSQDSYPEKVVLKYFHQVCWINASTSFLYVPKSKCNSKKPFCTKVAMYKETVSSLHHCRCLPCPSLGLTVIHKTPAAPHKQLKMPLAPFPGTDPTLLGLGVSLTARGLALLTCSASISYKSSLSIPKTGIASRLRLRPSLTSLIQLHIPFKKKPSSYWEVQQFWHSTKDARDLGSVPC